MTECIITSSVLIAVIIVLRFLFNGKISRRVQYALWGLVLLRLMMPFPLAGSDFSVMNWAEIGEDPVITYIAADSSKLPDLAPYEPGPGASEAEYQAAWAEYEHEIEQAKAAVGTPVTATDVLSIVWLAGSVTAGIWVFATNFAFYRRLKSTRKAFNRPGCRLPVYVSEHISSPCLFGILRPSVYLTPKAAESEESARHVLAHELCHYRHGDHIWSILRGVCLAAYWWNPLVWAAAVLSRNDSELACDEAVIKQIGEGNRLAYGYTLVEMIAVKKAHSGIICAATTMVSGKRGIRERLNMIVKNPKTVIPALAAVLLIAALCAACTFTGAQRTDAQTDGSGEVTAYAQQLYDLRNPYIGNAPADGALLRAMGVSEKLGGYTMELETKEPPYILRLNFNDDVTDAALFNGEMRANAMLLLALIDNASEIQWQYRCYDKAAVSEGTFTGSLSADEASALLSEDIKGYGRSAEKVQQLLDRIETGSDASVGYGLLKLGRGGEVIFARSLLPGDEGRQLAKDIIFSHIIKSTLQPGVDIRTLDECYVLRVTYQDGTIRDYYAYQKDGGPILQTGAGGVCTPVDKGLFERLERLASTTQAGADIVKYAQNFINGDIENYQSSGVKITDSKIVGLKCIARYEAMTDFPVEVWLLEYRLLPDDINKVVFAGGMQQENGWITEHSSMGQPCLIISYKDGRTGYLGNTWTGNFSEEGGLENALRMWLESNGYLPNQTYPGNHAVVLFTLSDGTRAELLLSQPVRQGDTGIWCVERWSDEHGNRYLVTPDADGPAIEYYKRLQRECDGGRLPGLLDPEQVALEYITGVLGQSATKDSITVIRGNKAGLDNAYLDACLSEAILNSNKGKHKESDFAAEAHTVLKVVESGNKTTVYAMALYTEFDYVGGGFAETGGSHMPVAVTFEKTPAGEYRLIEYWTPEDGSGYAPSIKKKFPAEIYKDAIDTQKYIVAHVQECYAKAIGYGRVNTEAILSKLVETICSSPAQMSNPRAYIDEHPIEYREMIYHRNYTLRYCFGRFEKGGQTGLEGHIMAIACREILGGEDIKVNADTGQGWYDAFKAHCRDMRRQKGDSYMIKNMPGSWLLLQMLDEAGG